MLETEWSAGIALGIEHPPDAQIHWYHNGLQFPRFFGIVFFSMEGGWVCLCCAGSVAVAARHLPPTHMYVTCWTGRHLLLRSNPREHEATARCAQSNLALVPVH